MLSSLVADRAALHRLHMLLGDELARLRADRGSTDFDALSDRLQAVGGLPGHCFERAAERADAADTLTTEVAYTYREVASLTARAAHELSYALIQIGQPGATEEASRAQADADQARDRAGQHLAEALRELTDLLPLLNAAQAVPA